MTVDSDTSNIVVKNISADSLFVAPHLTVGSIVVSINGIPCKGKTIKQAISIITQTQGVIKILAY